MMPWIHFHSGNDGKVQACCVSNIPFGNANTQSLKEIWYGEPIQKLREKFARGEKDNRCGYCIKLEAAGAKSIRMETFEKFPDISTEQVQLPIYFDIRFSNVCNFKCRTCWHGASSAWFADAQKLGTNKGQNAVIQNITDFGHFIENFGEALLQAEEIYFAGGEPLVTPEHYLLMNWLIENQSTQMRLRYNTNFSKLSHGGENVLDLWKHFPDVEIMASVDGIGQQAEYIRTGTNWNQLVKNRERIRHFPHIKFTVAPTISVLNIFHLPEMLGFLQENRWMEWNDVYINILERPVHYCIQILPENKKLEAEKNLMKFMDGLPADSTSLKNQLENCVRFMWAKDLSSQWEKFQQETEKLDRIRSLV